MIKIDASKLILMLQNPEKNANFKFIFADNPIYNAITQEIIKRKFKVTPSLFSGQNCIEEFVNYLSSSGMFEQAKPSIIELPEKLTQKNWNEFKKHFARLPQQPEVHAYFFAPMKIKNMCKEIDLPKNSICYFSYEPSDLDYMNCAYTILTNFDFLVKKPISEKENIVRFALENYSNDLISCFMHFDRMQKGQLLFNDALAGCPEVNGFHVADAIAHKNLQLIELRLNQCAQCGQDASGVFMAIVYFLKQVAHVYGALSQTQNLKVAFEQSKIPYPAQSRIKEALAAISFHKILAFFKVAANLEMEMRLQKNPHQYLSIEIINWLKA